MSRATFATVKLKHTAWQTTGSVLPHRREELVAERHAQEGASIPKAGTFGALELAARYSELAIDDATFPNYASAAGTPTKAKAWAVGLNWYLARAIKLVADYEHTTFTGGAATGDREAENFVVTRVQYAF